MREINGFLAAVLKSTGRALAAYAAGDLLAAHPETAEKFGRAPFDAWQRCLAHRVEELAVAVAARRPLIFVTQVQWATAALGARDVPADHFRLALQSLRAVFARELPEEVQALALTYLDQAIEASEGTAPDTAMTLSTDTPAGKLAASYLVAILEGDRRKALGLVLEAARNGQPVDRLYTDVIIPTQRELGRMWHTTEITVSEEHFASETTKVAIAQLALHAHERPPNGKTVLTASVSANQHAIALQIIAHLFEFDGWRVINLGADVPVGDLVQAVEFFTVDLVVLSTALSIQLPQVREAIEALRQSPRGSSVKILVGGHAFGDDTELALELGVDAHDLTVDGAVRTGRRLVGLGV